MKLIGIFVPFICLSMFSCNGGKSKNNQREVEDLPAQNPMQVTDMQQDTVLFPSVDGLMMRAVIYEKDSGAPVIVLCHQARFNNYEYAEIAPKLNSLGYTCMAIDMRSGGPMDDHENVTYNNAVVKGAAVEFADAEQDIVAAVNYANNKWHVPVMLWGSSYFGALAMKVAVKNDKVSSIVAFSPCENTDGAFSLKNTLSLLNKPTFISSTEKEAGVIEKLVSGVPAGIITQYFPETKGTHGSKCLWSSDPANSYYWEAVTDWLEKNKN